ncbi:DNA replication/repair protein RecF [Legionella sp. CNM-4043-24]|uniref:DNA replication/repair protein RecF n=1 Tax=Legionella sp. CNM-4043-24 TaxID=3421646 RepID=UPI00403A9716
MILSELQISCLRNMSSLRLSLHPRLNIISGNNGSGKTTFLEALYLLSTGHSFRTREISSLLTYGKDALTVFAKTDDDQRISIQKSSQVPTIARLNGQACSSSSELAAFLPSQVFYQDIFQFIDAGPSVRRSLLDWGLFHVEHRYLALWKDYRRALKQRNALLKQRASRSLLVPWNNLLAESGEQLDVYRHNYMRALSAEFQSLIPRLSDLDVSLAYYKGWDRKHEGKSLLDVLNASYESDLQRQFTHYGPHQADLYLVGGHFKVKQFLSRGQQKIILFALKFAQAAMLSQSCLYLIDDMCSELDAVHISRVMNLLSDMNGQFFITTRLEDNLFHMTDVIPNQSISLQAGVLNHVPRETQA